MPNTDKYVFYITAKE